jgi:hypothetical protein
VRTGWRGHNGAVGIGKFKRAVFRCQRGTAAEGGGQQQQTEAEANHGIRIAGEWRNVNQIPAKLEGVKLAVGVPGCVLFRPYRAGENCLGTFSRAFASLQPGLSHCGPSALVIWLRLY